MESGQLNVRWDDGREPRSKHHWGQQICNSHQPSKQMGQWTRQESRWPRHGPEESAHGCHGWQCCAWSSTEEACTWHTNRRFVHPSTRFQVDQVWRHPTSMEQARVVGQNGHLSLLFKYTPKGCKNQIVTAGRLLAVLDMCPSTTSNPMSNQDPKFTAASNYTLV